MTRLVATSTRTVVLMCLIRISSCTCPMMFNGEALAVWHARVLGVKVLCGMVLRKSKRMIEMADPVSTIALAGC